MRRNTNGSKDGVVGIPAAVRRTGGPPVALILPAAGDSTTGGPPVCRSAAGIPAASHREPFTILLILMKLLLRAHIDLLRRVHAVLERYNETLERLGEE